jgi:hypothetical protein
VPSDSPPLSPLSPAPGPFVFDATGHSGQERARLDALTQLVRRLPVIDGPSREDLMGASNISLPFSSRTEM